MCRGGGGEHRGSELGDAWEMKLFFFFFFFWCISGQTFKHLR